MLYMIFLFVVFGLAGTIMSLRLMAIEEQETGRRFTMNQQPLTRRGKIAVSIFWGLFTAVVAIFICGLWWDCDLTNPSSVCRVSWGY